MHIFSHVIVEGRVVNSNMNGFSSFPGNLFAVLVYYFEVRDVGFGMIVGHTVLVNSTADVTVVLFDSILQSSAGLTYIRMVKIFFGSEQFLNNVLFNV